MKRLSRFYVGLCMAFLYLPILVLIVFSFNESKSRAVFTGFSLKWYQALFSNNTILTALGNTLIIAVVSTVIATLIGVAAAIGINAMQKWLRGLVLNITYMPIVNPEIVTGVSLSLLFVFMREMAGLPIEMGFVTLILAHVTFSTPYVILNVLPKLRQMDKNIYNAAMDLGCSPMQAVLKVVLPEIMPGIISGAFMAFTFSIDDFVISYFVSGPTVQTLPIVIYAMTRKRVSPEINALSAIIFLVVIGVLFISNIVQDKWDAEAKRRLS